MATPTTTSSGWNTGFVAAMGATIGGVIGAFGGGQLVKAYMRGSPAQTRENATVLAVGGSAIIGALLGGKFAGAAASGNCAPCPPCLQAPCPPVPPGANTHLT
jgi:hypothetical protein